MPLVDLIRAGDVYFVRDGHHRISVARARGEEYIEAAVTVWTLAPQPAIQASRIYPADALRYG